MMVNVFENLGFQRFGKEGRQRVQFLKVLGINKFNIELIGYLSNMTSKTCYALFSAFRFLSLLMLFHHMQCFSIVHKTNFELLAQALHRC